MDSTKELKTGGKTRKRYEKNFISQVILELEQGRSRNYLCTQYGIARGTLKGWVVKYDSQNYRQGKRRSFTAFEKRKVVHSVLEGKMTIAQASVAYGIRDTDLVWGWVNQFKLKNGELSGMKRQNTDKKKPVVSSADEIKTLQQALEEAKLKIVALNMLIDVAEEQFKISIRKKPGAKQSPK